MIAFGPVRVDEIDFLKNTFRHHLPKSDGLWKNEFIKRDSIQILELARSRIVRPRDLWG